MRSTVAVALAAALGALTAVDGFAPHARVQYRRAAAAAATRRAPAAPRAAVSMGLPPLDQLYALKRWSASARTRAKAGPVYEKVVLYPSSAALFGLFIVYRAYRGTLVVLPAALMLAVRNIESGEATPQAEDATNADVNDKGAVKLRTGVLTTAGTVLTLPIFALRGVVKGAWNLVTGGGGSGAGSGGSGAGAGAPDAD